MYINIKAIILNCFLLSKKSFKIILIILKKSFVCIIFLNKNI